MSRLIALILLLIVIPMVLVFGFIIKLKYPGPIFFKQLREGKDGRTFYIWKLRTMAKNSAQVLAAILAKNSVMAKEWNEYGGFKKDPRIAGLAARLARQLSIDELPQLINILKGDMAFIGPRPLEMYLAERLSWRDRTLRNTVKPGLTGLWQIGPRSAASIRHMQLYDKLYVRNRNICLDTYILFKTIGVVLKQTGQ